MIRSTQRYSTPRLTHHLFSSRRLRKKRCLGSNRTGGRPFFLSHRATDLCTAGSWMGDCVAGSWVLCRPTYMYDITSYVGRVRITPCREGMVEPDRDCSFMWSRTELHDTRQVLKNSVTRLGDCEKRGAKLSRVFTVRAASPRAKCLSYTQTVVGHVFHPSVP